MAHAFFKKLPSRQKHEHGCIIVAGQAQGKSHWVQNQKEWVDADLLIGQYMPSELKAKAKEVQELVRLGAWVVSSTWWDLTKFAGNCVAVVSVPETRLKLNAKSKSFSYTEAKEQATLLKKTAKKSGIPVFSSFAPAQFHLTVSLSAKYSA